MINPITEEEIKEYSENVKRRYTKSLWLVKLVIGFSVGVFALFLFGCAIKVLGWHTLTLIGSLVAFNFIALSIVRYANRDR